MTRFEGQKITGRGRGEPTKGAVVIAMLKETTENLHLYKATAQRGFSRWNPTKTDQEEAGITILSHHCK